MIVWKKVMDLVYHSQFMMRINKRVIPCFKDNSNVLMRNRHLVKLILIEQKGRIKNLQKHQRNQYIIKLKKSVKNLMKIVSNYEVNNQGYPSFRQTKILSKYLKSSKKVRRLNVNQLRKLVKSQNVYQQKKCQ